MAYQQEREWSDQFIPQIRQIVGPYLLEPAPFVEDALRATDLIILNARDKRIACRVRRHSYLSEYSGQFTIRSQSRGGSKTELQKITDGWGDWMFYSFADQSETAIQKWYLINLDSWRAHMIRARNKINKGQIPNGDGTFFTWFEITSFPKDPPLLIAEGGSEQGLIAAA